MDLTRTETPTETLEAIDADLVAYLVQRDQLDHAARTRTWDTLRARLGVLMPSTPPEQYQVLARVMCRLGNASPRGKGSFVILTPDGLEIDLSQSAASPTPQED